MLSELRYIRRYPLVKYNNYDNNKNKKKNIVAKARETKGKSRYLLRSQTYLRRCIQSS